MEEEVRKELLKSIYEQHWLHARHVENERLWFTNIFGVIVAGLLAFLGTVEITDLPLFAKFAGSFVFILSILGYFQCVTWRAPFVEHTALISRMHEDALLKRYAPFTKEGRKLKWGVTAHELFLYFYAFMAGGALFLLLYVGLGAEKWSCWWISIVVSVILFLGLCSLWKVFFKWRGLFKKKEDEYRKHMGVQDP